jgi:hypothetical protein
MLLRVRIRQGRGSGAATHPRGRTRQRHRYRQILIRSPEFFKYLVERDHDHTLVVTLGQDSEGRERTRSGSNQCLNTEKNKPSPPPTGWICAHTDSRVSGAEKRSRREPKKRDPTSKPKNSTSSPENGYPSAVRQMMRSSSTSGCHRRSSRSGSRSSGQGASANTAPATANNVMEAARCRARHRLHEIITTTRHVVQLTQLMASKTLDEQGTSESVHCCAEETVERLTRRGPTAHPGALCNIPPICSAFGTNAEGAPTPLVRNLAGLAHGRPRWACSTIATGRPHLTTAGIS